MARCPLTYESLSSGRYSLRGVRLLSSKLHNFHDLPYTAGQEESLALENATKISIQGLQPKLSAKLNLKKACFELTTGGGTFILKPPHHSYPQVPENEDLTMRLGSLAGLQIPLHGLVYNVGDTLTYFVKRFDRQGRGGKIALEDFAVLLGLDRETKYEASVEKMIPVIEKFCTFPELEKIKFFRQMVFNFLVGNEDGHLKNFSLIYYEDKVELSPAYDLVNTTILFKAKEEFALTLGGKKSRFTRSDFTTYLGEERLNLSPLVIQDVFSVFQKRYEEMLDLIECSFLQDEMKEKYRALFTSRYRRLFPS